MYKNTQYSHHRVISIKKRSNIIFTEKDLASLQYLSGFCFRTIYSRLRNSPKHRTSISQQCMSILLAGKSDSDIPQSLIDAKDRGGLWRVHDKTVSIFKVCEIEFQLLTSGFHKNIDADLLVSKLLKDASSRSNFEYSCGIAELKVEKNIVKDLLYNLLLLYVHVRCHSSAKQMKEKHKKHKKEGKQSSLRLPSRRKPVQLNLVTNNYTKNGYLYSHKS